MRIAVLSAPGREARTWATLEQLAAQNPGVPFDVFRSSGSDPIGDFWELLRTFRGADLLALEDDITTARNLFLYAKWRWRSPFVTSFFQCGRRVLGQPVGALGHSFNQALKLPRRVIDRLLELDPPRRPGSAQDDALGEALEQIGEPIVYHRSLVQHLGAISTIWRQATATLEGRQAHDFPGVEFDCLTIG